MWFLVAALSAGGAGAQVVPEQVTLAFYQADFGHAVALQGDQLLVGAPDRAYPWGGLAGAVYPYENDGQGHWLYSGLEWTPLDAGEGDSFGVDLDIDGDLAIVGAWRADGTTLSNGPGAAYVFQNVGGQPPVWTQLAKLEPVSGTAYGWFGWRVAIDGQITSVVAPNDQGGAFYTFERDLGGTDAFGQAYHTWLPPGDTDLGCDVEVSGAWALASVCRQVYQPPPPAVQGEVLLFRWQGLGSWTVVGTLIPPVPEPDESFGASISASSVPANPFAEVWAAIGAPSSDPNQNGSVYVFKKRVLNPDWEYVTRIQPPEAPGTDASFGFSVAFENRNLVVGAGPVTGTAQNIDTGSAWIYRRTGSQFEPVARFAPSEPANGHWAGRSVAVSGNWIAVGDDDRVHLLRVPVFADGFESGSAVRWSSAVF